MVSKRKDGTNVIQGLISDELRKRVESVCRQHGDELNESKLVREGLEEVLPQYE